MSQNIKSSFLDIMNTYVNARHQAFKGHSLGNILRNELPAALKQTISSREQYEIKGSIGQGNWAVIPWLAIMNPRVTSSTQRGFYIVYLFSEDMQHLYLTFAQGVTETSKEEMERRNEDIRSRVNMEDQFRKDNDFSLGSSSKARDYVQSVAAYVPYSKDDFPTEEQLLGDLNKMINYYEEYIHLIGLDTVDGQSEIELTEVNNDFDIVSHIHSYITNKGFYFTEENIKNLYLSLKTKPFVILSGISGTGKTKIVQLFAESVGAMEENGQFKLIPVRPDWSDGADLIGFEDIKGEFKPSPLTDVLVEANKPENRDKPYFILLDEMNLARVEYYFSDFLSVMESREKVDGEYVSVPVVDRPEVGRLMLRNNVFIIGTVNMDETTHPFSPKVLDRANTIEYNDVQLANFSIFDQMEEPQAAVVSNEQLAGEYITLKDAFAEHEKLIREVTEWLVDVNQILEQVKLHFGYRVRDEVCFYMIYNEQGHLMDKEQAFDLQLQQKVLPRVSGNDADIVKVLKELYTFCTGHAWDADIDVERESRFPQSAAKLASMIKKAEHEGFTSFWMG
ncbi:MrcB family domain-containing protein [Siminovitchia fordii]|uniref:Type IV methyl-directed restriction enzyme EcoKMcrB subunit DNA-binding domain-containing protein n=1 Tax=Siminovitchia fordii TaxID=254759 RepID=A0ABQ4K0X6_9BACI|nr:DUF3578 domain-containing protein [Siminovitchia fordii]GIN19411.1 hypothetical protein J1TS3_05450 [Siminovitchia fordii]